MTGTFLAVMNTVCSRPAARRPCRSRPPRAGGQIDTGLRAGADLARLDGLRQPSCAARRALLSEDSAAMAGAGSALAWTAGIGFEACFVGAGTEVDAALAMSARSPGSADLRRPERIARRECARAPATSSCSCARALGSDSWGMAASLSERASRATLPTESAADR
jgi:hypothetical protein